jgi:AmpD protein
MQFQVDCITGLITPAAYFESPNQDERAEGTEIDLIVIHGISLPPNQFQGDAVINFFQNKLDPTAHPYFAQIADMKVSAHLFIRRDGTLIQFVPLHKRAWHAGQSEFNGRSRCNDFSIGIELEGADDIPYAPEQYTILADLCITLKQHYAKITRERIVGHSDISPGRKTDPGSAFNWNFFRNLLKKGGV